MQKPVSAEMKRDAAGSFIEVIGPFQGGSPDYIWATLVDHCAKKLSPNELRRVLANCESQLRSLGPENTPPVFEQMVADLKETMKQRKISFEPPPPSFTITFPGPRIRQIKQFFAKIRDKVYSDLTKVGLRFQILEAQEVKKV